MMPYFTTAHEWLTHSTLLLQARPSTTRITTKYSTSNVHKTYLKKKKKEDAKRNDGTPVSGTVALKAPDTIVTPAPATATLTIKTYDPVSGTTLKYTTDKAAEVGRLVQIMGKLGRGMAGLEMKDEVPPGNIEAPEKKSVQDELPGGKKSKSKKKNRK